MTIVAPAEACIALAMGPVQSITSVADIARDGTATALSALTYRLAPASDTLELDASISGVALRVVYVAGYGAANQVPRPIKYGMLAHIAVMYEQRGDTALAVPPVAEPLYAPFREVRL